MKKKAEAKALLEKEMESIKGTVKVAPQPKITRAQIEQIKERSLKAEPEKPVVSFERLFFYFLLEIMIMIMKCISLYYNMILVLNNL